MMRIAVSYKKKYEEYSWSRYGKYLTLLGTGKKRYLIMGLLFLGATNLLVVFCLLVLYPDPIYVAVVKFELAIGLAGFMLSMLISIRLKYWRDIVLFWHALFIPISIELFVASLVLFLRGGYLSTIVLSIAVLMLNIFLSFRNWKRGGKKLELLREKGLLSYCLDEKNWVYDDDQAKNDSMWLDLITYEGKSRQHEDRLKWLARLEKLHYLIPGSMIAFRRVFGHEQIILGVIFLVLGMLLFTGLIAGNVGVSTYLKIREWEREKGKPILLRWAWKKEHGKMFEKTG